MELITLRVSDNVIQCIHDQAKKEDRSISYIVRKVLEDHYKLNDSAPSTIESKPPKKVEQTKQPKKIDKPLERPLSRSELFRSISKNRA